MSDPPPPPETSSQPDDYTSGFPDYTESRKASGRVLHLNLWFLKYGVGDKQHAAALVISLLILFVLSIVVFMSLFSPENPVVERVVGLLGGVLGLTAGVAIGKSGAKSSDSG
ncbi:hypothetical protein [Halomonas salina]|uniref:hypothetical protein n=1 Tax=Halomonas salina TaxID=42565 RepID=UPI001268FE15|nr:hypothetical protein [Halomonas salina]